jgi:hypothetical protein
MRPSTACSRMSAGGSGGTARRFRGPPPRRISGDYCKGGGGGGTTVQPVNYQALGAAQQQSNVATAETQASLNNINTFSPYGSTTYAANQIDPSTGLPSSYSATQSLSPDYANLLSAQNFLARGMVGGALPFTIAGQNMVNPAMGMIGEAAGLYGAAPTSLNMAGVPNVGFLSPSSFATSVTGGAGGQPIPNAVTGVPLQTNLGLQTSVVPQGVPALTAQAQNAAYSQQTQYLDPQWNQAQESLTQSLADQGIEEGSPAYSRAMLDFNNQKQQAYSNAQYNAVQAGNAQEQALYGQALAGGQFTNQALTAMGQFQNASLLSGAQLTNQAQQQLFGQGLSLADLYNQAVTAASGQNLQAQQGNLAAAQAAFQAPYTAAGAQLGAGTGLFGTGIGSLAGVLPAITAWPTGGTAIPNLSPGTATGVQPTNLSSALQASTQAGQTAYLQGQQNLSNMLGYANLGLNALGIGGGSGIGGLFGSSAGGGGLFNLGSDMTDFSGGLTGAGEEVANSAGGGGILGAIGSIFGF